MRIPTFVIFLLFLIAVPLKARPQTTPGTQPAKTTPKTAGPAKSKALLAAEKRIAELEIEMADRDNKLAAAEAKLQPLKKMMADVAATAIPISKIAPSDTVGRNRAILFVDPSGALLWYAKSADGKYVLANLSNQSDTTTVADLLAGSMKSVTAGDLMDDIEALGKKEQGDYNALVDKYNSALALLRQSNELLSQEQAFLQQMKAYTAAQQAAERQARIYEMYNTLQRQAVMQQQNFASQMSLFSQPVLRPTINCTSTAFAPGTVNTTCH